MRETDKSLELKSSRSRVGDLEARREGCGSEGEGVGKSERRREGGGDLRGGVQDFERRTRRVSAERQAERGGEGRGNQPSSTTTPPSEVSDSELSVQMEVRANPCWESLEW